MAARAARIIFPCGSKSFRVLRNVSSKDTVQYSLRALQRTSASSFHGNPAVRNLIQSLENRSSPTFVNYVRRIEDFAGKIDTVMCGISDNHETSQQDISLLETCAEDDDDQFRKRDILLDENYILKNVTREAELSQQSGSVFAIVHFGGSQFKVSLNDKIIVNKLPIEVGTRLKLEKVLLIGGEHFTIVGRPFVTKNSVEVEATIVEHIKNEKIIVFKKKRRKGYKRTQGHRQALSVLRIEKIFVKSHSL